MPKRAATSDDGSILALRVLTFIAGDTERLDRFLALTGVSPAAVQARAADRDFLAGVLEHLLAHEALLLAFCAEEGVRPEAPARALGALTGGRHGR